MKPSQLSLLHLVRQPHIACRQGWSLAHRTQSKSIGRHLYATSHARKGSSSAWPLCVCVRVHNRDSLNGTRANRASQGRGNDDGGDDEDALTSGSARRLGKHVRAELCFCWRPRNGDDGRNKHDFLLPESRDYLRCALLLTRNEAVLIADLSFCSG